MPPKRKPSAKAKASPKKKKTKAPPPPPTVLTDTMEAEQITLAEKTFGILKKQKQVILVGEEGYPGCAKTIVGGETNNLLTQKLVSKGHTVLTFYVGKSRKLAIQHRADMNAPKTPAPPFQLSDKRGDIPKVIANLDKDNHTICCMTRDMAYKLFEGDKKDPTPQLPSILEDGGVTAVILVIDEVHQIYKHAHFCIAVEKMREENPDIKWYVMGISSTPELDTASQRTNALKLFGGEKLPEYTTYGDDFESMKTKMQTLPPKPLASDFVVINLPSPVGDKEYKMEMQTL